MTERALLPKYNSKETVDAMLATNIDTFKEAIRKMPGEGNLHKTTKFLTGRTRKTASRRRTREHKQAAYDELLRKKFKVIRPF